MSMCGRRSAFPPSFFFFFFLFLCVCVPGIEKKFLVGLAVAVAMFLLIFGLVWYFRRWLARKGLSISSDAYARVVDESRNYNNKETAIEMQPTFTIGSDREDLVRAALELHPNPELAPHEFESFWLAFQSREHVNFSLTFGDTNIEEVTCCVYVCCFCFFVFSLFFFLFLSLTLHQILSSQRIRCMASGAAGPKKKYYFFAREKNTGSIFLMEIFVLPRDREMEMEIRCGNSAMLPDMIQYMKSAMRPFSRVSGVRN